MKRQTLLDSGRCLNCLSLGHTANNCACPSKCRKCKSNFRIKHAAALHDCYHSTTENLGAADKALPVSISPETQIPAGCNSHVVYKMSSGENRVVLLRTIVVTVTVALGTTSGPGASSNMTDFRFCEVQNRRRKCCSLVQK